MHPNSVTGVVTLGREEQGQVRGGDLVEVGVLLGMGLATAMGASFAWGYNNLGPYFNRYF